MGPATNRMLVKYKVVSLFEKNKNISQHDEFNTTSFGLSVGDVKLALVRKFKGTETFRSLRRIV